MANFIRVAEVDAIPDPGKLLVEVDERMVVVFRIGDQFYCLDDVCTHDGGPLGEGIFDNNAREIRCPRHGARFDICSGKALSMPATENTVAHDVRVEGGAVYVSLREERTL